MGGVDGLRERKKEACRVALREAGLRLASERGIDQVTVDAICAEVGVSPRTFFNYFSAKEECLLHVDVGAAEWIREAVARRPITETPMDVVLGIVRQMAERMQAREQQLRLRAQLITRYPHLRAKHSAGYERVERTLADSLDQRGTPAPVLAAVGIAVLRACYQPWSTSDTRALPDLVDDAFSEIKGELQ
ncbi:TetR family transcriptional regulator [Pseudonocardiaceae bacterium YIM PH 21723]|nr:TetR family transcriptional regulator [Pseudonocardiaceae bacterium YIM PH 21723]